MMTLEGWAQVLDGKIIGDTVEAEDPYGNLFKLRVDAKMPGCVDVWGLIPNDELRDWVWQKAELPEDWRISLVTDDILDLVEENITPRAYVLTPVLKQQELMSIVGWRGVGKTHVAHAMGLAIATGGQFLRWHAERPLKVALIDGELPARMLQERARAALRGLNGPPPAKRYFRLVAMDRQPVGFSLNLADPAHQALVEAEIEYAEVLILDNLSTLFHGGSENDEQSWGTAQAWLLRLRRRGLTVVMVHHAGRALNGRGSSAREDVLDVMIDLRRPSDYDPTQGARFEVHLTKARGIFGPDAAPFEARLETSGGANIWSCEDLKNPKSDTVRDLTRRGRTARQIEAEAGISRSTVSRIQARLREAGDL